MDKILINKFSVEDSFWSAHDDIGLSVLSIMIDKDKVKYMLEFNGVYLFSCINTLSISESYLMEEELTEKLVHRLLYSDECEYHYNKMKKFTVFFDDNKIEIIAESFELQKLGS